MVQNNHCHSIESKHVRTTRCLWTIFRFSSLKEAGGIRPSSVYVSSHNMASGSHLADLQEREKSKTICSPRTLWIIAFNVHQ